MLCRESPGGYYISILARIVRKIEPLEEEWSENVPPITALVFNTDGSVSKWTRDMLIGDGAQPTLRNAAYP